MKILFISGAGLPTWIWDDVRRHLGDSHQTLVAARPARVDPELTTPQCPSVEREPATSRRPHVEPELATPRRPRQVASLRDYAKAALDSAPDGEFAIVAHSAGGVIGAEVASLAPDRVSGFLAVSAVIPEPGGSFLSAMPAPNRWLLAAVMRLAGTRPPNSAIRSGLAHGLDEKTTERLIADFTAESPLLYRGRTTHRTWTGRRGYVFTDNDRELPAAVQRRSAQRLGPDGSAHLGCGHLPMLENPQALADTITGLLARTALG